MYEQEVMDLVEHYPAFLGTVDEDRPSVRLMKTYVDQAGHIWLVTEKNVNKVPEIKENSRVELCASGRGDFVRFQGKLVKENPDRILIQKMVEAIPEMQDSFSGPSDPQITIFRFLIYKIIYAKDHKEYTTGFNIPTTYDFDPYPKFSYVESV